MLCGVGQVRSSGGNLGEAWERLCWKGYEPAEKEMVILDGDRWGVSPQRIFSDKE